MPAQTQHTVYTVFFHVTALLACLILFPLSSPAAESPNGPIGEINSFVGKLMHSTDGKAWREVTPDEIPLSLNSGDWLKTGKGRAQVSYPDGTVLRLMENTNVKVSQQKPEGQDKALRDIFTKFGHVWTDVKPNKGMTTQFSSPTAVAGIRGTSFDWIFVEALSRTTMDMNEGRAFLQSVREGAVTGQGTDVSAGYRSSVPANRPPTDPRDFPQYPEPMIQLYNQMTHGQQPSGPPPPTPEEIAQRIASGQNPTDLVFEAIAQGVDPADAVGQVIEAAVAQGVPLAQVAQQIANEAYTRGVPADSVALVITQSAVAGAAASGQDVGDVVGDVSQGVAQGLVEGATQNGDNVGDAARLGGEGAARGAIEGAAQTGQDVDQAAQAAAQGTVEGTAAGAASTGQDANQLARDAAQGLGSGAVQGARNSGVDQGAATGATQSGATAGAANSGVNAGAVGNAVTQGAQNAPPPTTTPESGGGTTETTSATIPTTLTTQTTEASTTTAATTTAATTTAATTTAAPTTTATPTTTAAPTTTTPPAPPPILPGNGGFESGDTNPWIPTSGSPHAWESGSEGGIPPTQGDWVGKIAWNPSGELLYPSLNKPADNYQYLALDYYLQADGCHMTGASIEVNVLSGTEVLLGNHSDSVQATFQGDWFTVGFDASNIDVNQTIMLNVSGQIDAYDGYVLIDWLRWTVDQSTWQGQNTIVVLSPYQ